MDLKTLIHGERHATADYHLVAARLWVEKGEGKLHTPLVYAAFEYRCAVERAVLELYGIMREISHSAEAVEDIGSFKNVMNRLIEFAGGNKKALYRLLKFNSILAEFMGHSMMGQSVELSIPDVGVLHKMWQNVSNYCHQQVVPENTWGDQEWVEEGYQTLQEVDEYLQKIMIDKYLDQVKNLV